MEVLLISPRYSNSNTLFWNFSYALKQISKSIRMPIKASSYPLSLPLVAALIKRNNAEACIRIIDENIDKIEFSKIKSGLVGITANTLQIERAFQIADKIREQNQKVTILLGGAHFGNTEDKEIVGEALCHADSIIIGETDNLWGKILTDLKDKQLKQTYTSSNDIPHLNTWDWVLPKFDLLPLESYLFRNIETSRGCNRQCSFCNATPNLRFKQPDDVIQEIKYLREIESRKGIEHRSIFFSDSLLNPTGYSQINKVEELMEKLILYKEKRYSGDILTWSGQVNSQIGMKKFDTVLSLMATSGAKRLLIGFESFYYDKDKGEKLTPEQKKKKFSNTIKKVRSKGIDVIASFMIGFDNEPDSIFEEIYDFIKENGLVLVQITILTPFPGTKDFERLRKEGRLLKKDGRYEWSKYDCTQFVFTPRQNIKDKQTKYYELFKDIYSNKSIAVRKKIRQQTLSYGDKELLSEKLIIKSFQWVSNSIVKTRTDLKR